MVLSIVILIVVLVAIVLIARSQRARILPRAGADPAPTNVTNLAFKSVGHQSPRNAEEALALLATRAYPQGERNLTTIVQTHVTDQTPGDWQLDLDHGRCALIPGLAEAAPLALSASTAHWIDLATQRISFASAVMKGAVRAEGDLSIAMSLDGEFAGPPDYSRLSSVRQAGSNPTNEPDGSTEDGTGGWLSDLPTSPWTPEPTAPDGPGMSDGKPISPAPMRLEVRRTEDGKSKVVRMSVVSETSGAIDPEALRSTIRQALLELPAGATREQKAEAIRAALRDVPNAEPLAAILARGGLGFKTGAAGIGGALLEGLIESLFEGS